MISIIEKVRLFSDPGPGFTVYNKTKEFILEIILSKNLYNSLKTPILGNSTGIQ
jgi:hypothetical protein